MDIRPATQDDHDWIINCLQDNWGSEIIVIDREQIDASQALCLIASPHQGLLIYRDKGADEFEVIAIKACQPGQGTGRLLLDRLVAQCQALQKRSIIVTTTNDNLPALRFYQKYGFGLLETRIGAVNRARETIKLEIPMRGHDGIPIRDEIVLRLALDQKQDNRTGT